MIQVHSAPGMIYDRVALDFSDAEKQRIKEICIKQFDDLFAPEQSAPEFF